MNGFYGWWCFCCFFFLFLDFAVVENFNVNCVKKIYCIFVLIFCHHFAEVNKCLQKHKTKMKTFARTFWMKMIAITITITRVIVIIIIINTTNNPSQYDIAGVEVRIHVKLLHLCYCLHRMNRRRIPRSHMKRRWISRINSKGTDRNDLIFC